MCWLKRTMWHVPAAWSGGGRRHQNRADRRYVLFVAAAHDSARLQSHHEGARPCAFRRCEAVRAVVPSGAVCGGGAARSDAGKLVQELAEVTNAPIVTTLPARGVVPDSDPKVLGMLGMHGTIAATGAVQRCDLLVAIGARFDDRVTGKLDAFAPGARVIHIDIDPAEIGKNRQPDVPIVGDVATVLKDLIPEIKREQAVHGKPDTSHWWEIINDWREKYPIKWDEPTDGSLAPQWVIKQLSDLADSDTIWVTGVGQHQMWATQLIDFEKPHSWLSSGGLGTMGYGLPAAIGARVGSERFHEGEKPVWLIDGDGSFQMTSEELATAFHDHTPVKIALLNNSVYGMVRQWQTLFYGEHYSATNLMDGENTPEIVDVPDFVKLAEAYGCIGMRAFTEEEAIERSRRPTKSTIARCLSTSACGRTLWCGRWSQLAIPTTMSPICPESSRCSARRPLPTTSKRVSSKEGSTNVSCISAGFQAPYAFRARREPSGRAGTYCRPVRPSCVQHQLAVRLPHRAS